MSRETTAALRWVVLAAAMTSAVAHVPEIEHHLAEAPYMGVLFVAYTTACAAVAVAAAARPSRPVLLTAAGLCGAAVVTYAATRLVAFPQLAHDVGHWREPLGVLAVLSELVTVGAALALARRRTTAPTSGWRSPGPLARHQGAH